jgi:hypothetical protein
VIRFLVGARPWLFSYSGLLQRAHFRPVNSAVESPSDSLILLFAVELRVERALGCQLHVYAYASIFGARLIKLVKVNTPFSRARFAKMNQRQELNQRSDAARNGCWHMAVGRAVTMCVDDRISRRVRIRRISPGARSLSFIAGDVEKPESNRHSRTFGFVRPNRTFKRAFLGNESSPAENDLGIQMSRAIP